ncbi:MAG: CHAD domain-containing protein [Verrucomicrobia bacterium]|nr:MAG: CHAD domain-containing protein [Verrucomicrobiota bacterium]
MRRSPSRASRKWSSNPSVRPNPATDMQGNRSARAVIKAWQRETQHLFRLICKLERATAVGDVNALHDLRVAIRRLRVLLRALEKPLARTNAKRVAKRWQQFTRELSPLRDVDVWRNLLQALSAATPAFRRRVLGRLDGKHDNRASLLASRIWSQLKRDTHTLLATEIPMIFTAATQPDRVLGKAWEEAITRTAQLARSHQLAQPDVAHKVRIACRRARYLAEFFALVARHGKTQRAWLKTAQRYQAAQAALGQTHDTDTLLEFLHTQRLRLPAKLRAALVKRRNQGLVQFRRARKNLR